MCAVFTASVFFLLMFTVQWGIPMAINTPMGSDPAPFVTNLFLFIYKCKMGINASKLRASFLNSDIIVKQREFENELHDEKNAFPFSIVRIPYRDFPTKVFYAAVG